jgi:hypothetical protein
MQQAIEELTSPQNCIATVTGVKRWRWSLRKEEFPGELENSLLLRSF